jgi:hypothetical protein
MYNRNHTSWMLNSFIILEVAVHDFSDSKACFACQTYLSGRLGLLYEVMISCFQDHIRWVLYSFVDFTAPICIYR